MSRAKMEGWRNGRAGVSMKVRIAVAPSFSSFDPDTFSAFIDGLEHQGFDTVWLSDIPMGAATDPLVALAHAAAHTTRLKLGTNIVPLGRNPMVLAKQLAQLDLLSNGRLLLSFVPGVDQPGERGALGIGRANRGRLLEEIIAMVRAWWNGDAVTAEHGPYVYEAVTVRPQPRQVPLEIWLGGMGPVALERAGRLADGWLGAVLEPAAAGEARRAIEQSARDAGRHIDADHFGLSLAYSRVDPTAETIAALRARRPDASLEQLLPVGREALRALLRAHIDNGITKFVLRPTAGSIMSDLPTSGDDEIRWLADAVLDLQT
jgi:probable F420-dependent oxidoreductase